MSCSTCVDAIDSNTVTVSAAGTIIEELSLGVAFSIISFAYSVSQPFRVITPNNEASAISVSKPSPIPFFPPRSANTRLLSRMFMISSDFSEISF